MAADHIPMRTIWVSAMTGALGVICGAVIGPLLQHYLSGPSEGIVGVNVQSIPEASIDSRLREQVNKYPVFIKITHYGGPIAKGITVTLQSKNSLTKLEPKQHDDTAHTEFSNDNKILTINVPELRKYSTLQYQVYSIGDPVISYHTVISQGTVISGAPPEETKSDGPFQTSSSTIWRIVSVVIIFVVFVIFSILIPYIIAVGHMYIGRWVSNKFQDR